MLKLTKRVIDAAPHPARGQVFLRDGELKGFAVRITRGSKSFVLEKAINGRVRRITLGRYGVLTVEQARALAIEKLADIAKGLDPAEQRREQRRVLTFGELWDVYWERHASLKKSKANDLAMFNRHLAPWRGRKLTAITRGDVAKLHAELRARYSPAWSNRIIALIRHVYNCARDWGIYSGENPAARVRFYREVKRDRFVRPDELPRLWAAISAERNPFVRAAFMTALLTGARRSEVLTMRWQDVDLQQGIWRISETKAGRPHYVPLPRPVLEELQNLPRLNGNEYVFCGRWGKGHLVDPRHAWLRIRSEAGLHDLRLHDLRRTLGSWLAASGASLLLIGKALNHSQPSTTAIYARLDLEPVRVALEANATRMLSVIEQARAQEDAHGDTAAAHAR